MTDIKACIFDLDGVIVDTAKYHLSPGENWRQNLDLNLPKHITNG